MSLSAASGGACLRIVFQELLAWFVRISHYDEELVARAAAFWQWCDGERQDDLPHQSFLTRLGRAQTNSIVEGTVVDTSSNEVYYGWQTNPELPVGLGDDRHLRCQRSRRDSS